MTSLIDTDATVLVTGSNGFIGARVVQALLDRGIRRIKCFARPSGNLDGLNEVLERHPHAACEVIRGNLLSNEDCKRATGEAEVVFHLAAGIDKSFAGSFMNSVVATRNLIEASLESGWLKRFVNVSSFAVYSPQELRRGAILDESCPILDPPHARGDAYTYAKIKQDAVVLDYADRSELPYVIIRPGAVYGPGKQALTGRIGIDTFGTYLHMGGRNRIPLVYVDNCADAIAMAGLTPNIDGHIFNVVDDDLPRSCDFLRAYKREVRPFFTLPVPKTASYLLCTLWERYSKWSEGQLPPVFNRIRWSAEWKGNRYSNAKLKRTLGWRPQVPFDTASKRYFEFQRSGLK